jgi:threonyl-tRNA synthetase
MLNITLPDGKQIQVAKLSSVASVANSISISLGKNTIAAKVNEVLVDTSYQLTSDAKLELITTNSPDAFHVLNHSSAHLLAQAISILYPKTQFGVGPAIEEGFYYDFVSPTPITEADLINIEKKMLELAKTNMSITRKEVTKKEALELFKDDKFKQELIKALKGKITIYQQGDFYDLCLGPHLPNTSNIKYVKLLSVAGSYWHGDAKKDIMQRIYGVAFFSQQQLNDHLLVLEERKARDHRKIGKEMKLFMFSPLVGSGLPIWLPNGTIILNQLQDYIKSMERKFNYQLVVTPVLGSIDLYKTSGHWQHYHEDMFTPIEEDNETLILRPMSCPHHVVIYKSELHSYRELPIRYAEQVLMFRHEASGALTGMERVRAMNLTDSHVFCRPDQIRSEFKHALTMILKVLDDLHVKVDYYRLSLHDKNNKEKYFDDEKMWELSETMLAEVLKESKVDYVVGVGEAAFYGPKLDIQIKTVLNHDITISTIQLDFLLPQRFELNYVDSEGNKVQPVMIHRGLIGTYERFLAILIEQTKGVFPLWLSPVQVNVLPVADAFNEYSQQLVDTLLDANIRVKLDNRNEKLGYRLRESQVAKVPFSLVIGQQEVDTHTVTYRKYGESEQINVSLEEFIALLNAKITSKE